MKERYKGMILLVCLPIISMCWAEPLLYKGVDRQIELADLQSLFPDSSHAIWSSKGKIYHPSSEEFSKFMRVGGIKYTVRLSKEEAFDDVYYIQATALYGWIENIRLSFEKPDNFVEGSLDSWEDSHYLRHPECDGHKSRLGALFGDPDAKPSRWVERIYYRPFEWKTAEATITLNCYQLDGKGKVLAQDVIFSEP